MASISVTVAKAFDTEKEGSSNNETPSFHCRNVLNRGEERLTYIFREKLITLSKDYFSLYDNDNRFQLARQLFI